MTARGAWDITEAAQVNLSLPLIWNSVVRKLVSALPSTPQKARAKALSKPQSRRFRIFLWPSAAEVEASTLRGMRSGDSLVLSVDGRRWKSSLGSDSSGAVASFEEVDEVRRREEDVQTTRLDQSKQAHVHSLASYAVTYAQDQKKQQEEQRQQEKLSKQLAGLKRDRSVSGRLRLSSVLYQRGDITSQERGILKELILAGEKNNRRGQLESAIEQFLYNEDASALVGLLRTANSNPSKRLQGKRAAGKPGFGSLFHSLSRGDGSLGLAGESALMRTASIASAGGLGFDFGGDVSASESGFFQKC